MAQTGYTPILIYSSSTVSQTPVAGNLTNSTLGSELAINITDGKLFYKDNANAVQVIAWKTTPTTAGGTGLTSYTAGDLLYYASGTTLTKLGIGSAYQALQVNAGGTAPSWQASATSTLTAQGDLLYASAANTLARLAKNTTATRYLSNTGSSNNPAWAQVDLTNGVTGTLPVGNGGTNLTSFTSGGVVYAASTSSLTTGTKLNFDGANLQTGFSAGMSSWNGSYNCVSVNGAANSFFGWNGGALAGIACGAFIDNTFAWKYNITGQAVSMIQVNDSAGNCNILVAPSGTSGNAITWTTAFQALTPTAGVSDVKVNTGNLIIGTSGKGIDFSATAGTGTSELLADYEEGTWTPRNGYVTLTNNVTARYTKVGRLVYATFNVNFPVNSQGNLAEILDLPFSAVSTTTGSATFTDYGSILMLQINFGTGGNIYNSAGTALTNANLSGKQIIGMYVYSV